MLGAELEAREERPAYVRFETRAVESKRLSLEAGRSVSVDVDYALITPPYSRDLVVIKVDQWLENTQKNVRDGKTPKAWLDAWEKAYDAFKQGKETPLNGTPIKEWSAISPAQIKNLIAMNILTIEDLANVNDEGLRRIGMGGQDLKRKAVTWLQAAEDHGPLTMKVSQLEKENDQLRGQIEGLIEKIKALETRSSVTTEVHREPVEEISAADILDDEPVDAQPSVMENAANVIEKTAELSLEAQYEAKFGKPPHHRMKEETIREKLRE